VSSKYCPWDVKAGRVVGSADVQRVYLSVDQCILYNCVIVFIGSVIFIALAVLFATDRKCDIAYCVT